MGLQYTNKVMNHFLKPKYKGEIKKIESKKGIDHVNEKG